MVRFFNGMGHRVWSGMSLTERKLTVVFIVQTAINASLVAFIFSQ